MIGRMQEMLPAMFALAHQRTEGARVELAGMLADVFLQDDSSLSLREEELVDELIDQLMQTRSPATRAHLLSKFADTARMPRRMALNLARDSIDIARPILNSCATLTDEDLISLVDTQDRDRSRAVAERATIAEAVVDALVATGDIRTMQLVAENLGAKLTPKAIETIADAARFAAELREPIMKRDEMPAEAAVRLYWWVSQDLRRYALKRFGITTGQIDQALAKTIEDLLSYHQLDRTNDEVMAQVADWLGDRQAISPKILPQILRLGHFRLFAIIIGRLTNLEMPLIDAIMAESGGRELAVVCRGLGIDKAGFVSIFLLSRGSRQDDQVVHPRELSHALVAFDRLSTNLANDLLRSWKADPSYLLKRSGEDEITLEPAKFHSVPGT